MAVMSADAVTCDLSLMQALPTPYSLNTRIADTGEELITLIEKHPYLLWMGSDMSGGAELLRSQMDAALLAEAFDLVPGAVAASGLAMFKIANANGDRAALSIVLSRFLRNTMPGMRAELLQSTEMSENNLVSDADDYREGNLVKGVVYSWWNRAFKVLVDQPQEEPMFCWLLKTYPQELADVLWALPLEDVGFTA